MNLESDEAADRVSPGSKEALVRALAHPRFEVVPVKGVIEQAGYLPPRATVTVTCSPSRGLEHSLHVAEELSRLDVRIVPHISARLVRDTAHLRDILRRIADLGIREIFVIGGDSKEPVGQFSSALGLLQAMADIGHDLRDIGIAAYPESHPLVDDATLRQALMDKQPFATYMVSQICFDPLVLATWLAATRHGGITLPLWTGIPGVVDTARLLRISMKIGVGESTRFLAKHTGIATRLLGRGYNPDQLVERLGRYFGDPAYDIQGIHINTFNGVESTEKWRRHMLHVAGG